MCRPIIYFLFIIMLCQNACSSKDTNKSEMCRNNTKHTHSIVKEGFSIPVFDNPSDQLNYALTWFSDSIHKKAALEAIGELFPKARREIARAKLELAYLSLGYDYRFANASKCRQAISNYRKIIEEYKEFSFICVKAYWYIAWIYTDLLKEKEKGLSIYEILIKKFPEEKFSPGTELPRMNKVIPDIKKDIFRKKYSWASIALLEIVKNSDTTYKSLKAFNMLWKNYRKDIATGYALLEILKRCKPTKRLHKIAMDYININSINPALNQDILCILKTWND